MPIYNGAGQIIGGVGISGDTSCADHEIAKRVRREMPDRDLVAYAYSVYRSVPVKVNY